LEKGVALSASGGAANSLCERKEIKGGGGEKNNVKKRNIGLKGRGVPISSQLRKLRAFSIGGNWKPCSFSPGEEGRRQGEKRKQEEKGNKSGGGGRENADYLPRRGEGSKGPKEGVKPNAPPPKEQSCLFLSKKGEECFGKGKNN